MEEKMGKGYGSTNWSLASLSILLFFLCQLTINFSRFSMTIFFSIPRAFSFNFSDNIGKGSHEKSGGQNQVYQTEVYLGTSVTRTRWILIVGPMTLIQSDGSDRHSCPFWFRNYFFCMSRVGGAFQAMQTKSVYRVTYRKKLNHYKIKKYVAIQ